MRRNKPVVETWVGGRWRTYSVSHADWDERVCVYTSVCVYMSVSGGVGGMGQAVTSNRCHGKFPTPNPASCLFPTPAKGHQNFPEEEDLGDIQFPSVLSPRGNAHAALPEFM